MNSYRYSTLVVYIVFDGSNHTAISSCYKSSMTAIHSVRFFVCIFIPYCILSLNNLFIPALPNIGSIIFCISPVANI